MAVDDAQVFTLTDEHLTLLRATYIGWDDCEFGAPAIDCKRPYGNSSVVEDMAELLGVAFDPDDGVNKIDAERLTQLHRETQTALQILVRSASLRTGEYRAPKYTADWQWVDPNG